MQAFKNVKKLKTATKSGEQGKVVSAKKLFTLGSLFCVLLSLNILGFSLPYFGFSNEVKQITSSWSPNLQDIGKLKYVLEEENLTEKEVGLLVSEMAMPFENVFVSKADDCFAVNGLGSLVVKSCLAGKVTKIEDKGLSKTVTISHGKGLVSVYSCLDNVGVKEGDSVKKNTAIGVSYSSQINLKILLGGKTVAGLIVKDGEMSFS